MPTVDLTGCKCLLGYTQVESICVTEQQNCHNGTLNPNTGICYCTVVGMKFVATVGCVCRDSKMMYNVQLNICACITSYYIFEGACKPCWDNSISADDFTTCVCIKGYILSGKSCIRPNINCYNGTLDLDTLTCKCDYSFTRFVDKIGCVCRDPFSYFSLAVKNCVCIPGYYLAEVCTKCWLNASPSPDITTCLCDPGYFASSKSCINIQQNCFNGTFNPTTNTCYCPIFGMQFVPLIGCLCKDPNAYFSSILNICTCNPGYYYLNQVCTKCWDKS